MASRSHSVTHTSRKDSSRRVINPTHRPLPDNNTYHRQPSRTPAGLQPAVPARVRSQTHASRPRGHWDRPDMIHLPTKHGMPTFNGSLLTASISKANDTFRTAAMTLYILQHYPCKCCIFSRYLLSQTLIISGP